MPHRRRCRPELPFRRAGAHAGLPSAADAGTSRIAPPGSALRPTELAGVPVETPLLGTEVGEGGPRRRVLVALNPHSGMGAAEHLAEARRRILERRSMQVEAIVPEAATPAELAAACRAIARSERLDAVIVRGGDGMVQLGVSLVAGTEVPLGIVPAGSGNDFARAMGIPRRNPADAIEAILSGLEHPDASIRAIDAIRVTVDGRRGWAANSVNMGFDAEVNRRANELTRLRGTTRYVVALAQSLRRLRAIPFRIGIDGAEPAISSHVLVAAMNGTSVGGGIRITPDADLADGLLDLAMVRPVARKTLASFFPLAFAGMHRSLPFFEERRARRLVVEVPAGVPIYADGEPLAVGGRVELEVVPAAWRLLRGTARG
ncbi:Diacylglycerol kinase [Pseudoclavibacter triregionum]|nr:Diacylglycerol kinase [Pseudoclavibacter triregionum]